MANYEDLRAYEEAGLEIVPKVEGRTLRTTWRGKSTARDPGETLRPYFGELARIASSSGLAIELRASELEYVNSSTLTAFITILKLISQRKVDATLCYDDRVGWQKRSFGALRVLEKPGGHIHLRTSHAG